MARKPKTGRDSGQHRPARPNLKTKASQTSAGGRSAAKRPARAKRTPVLEQRSGEIRRAQKRDPPRLTIFISYASEDYPIAHGIAKALDAAIQDAFAEIFFDKWTLTPGEDFRSQLIKELRKTKYLIIVSTDVKNKDAYAFPAWEVGFFENLLERDPSRKIIPLFLKHAPPAVAGFQGFDLQVPLELLPQSIADFNAHNDVDPADPLVSLIQGWQNEVDAIQREMGYSPGSHRSRADAASTVKAIRLAVFSHMKTKEEAVIKPQKQVTIISTGTALKASESNLPMDAMLVPTGGSSLSIFGLAEEKISWERFLGLTAGPHQDSWCEAITSVIKSGHAGRINVDNSQVILSIDESKAYRVILTTATKFWDDRIEFSLYFVETLQRTDHGDEDTTRLLKGLQILCRYRFMFLEKGSLFSAEHIVGTTNESLVALAGQMLNELNLMRQESRIDLASEAYWTKTIGGTGIREMRDEFYPRETKVRELCGEALKARNDPAALARIRADLIKLIGELEQATRPFNTAQIRSIGEKLLHMVEKAAPELRAAQSSAK